MKKILFSVAIIMCVFALTGCGSNKTLQCSKDFSSSMPYGIKMVQDSTINFKGNKVDTMDMVMSFEIPSTYASMASTITSSMQSTYEQQYGKYDGITVKLNKISDLKFEIVISIDYENISDSTKTAIGAVGSESYSVNRRQLENQGYTCK